MANISMPDGKVITLYFSLSASLAMVKLILLSSTTKIVFVTISASLDIAICP
jgi:hypothetical protein